MANNISINEIKRLQHLAGLNESENSDNLFMDVLELIRNRTRQMNDDDVFEFHEKLKTWVNKLI
jgi:hypothetical protein